jgi:CDP-glycerol glycerophosphotransferase (TagB/SpsB family)/glycosyltransferase involved in cell wall biosynthesis
MLLIRSILNRLRSNKLQNEVAQSKYFSTDWYREKYKPQLADFSGSPVKHYIMIGWKLGNDPSPFFSTQMYLSRYKDIRDSGICPLVHFLITGINEERVIDVVVSKVDAKPSKICGSVLFVINAYDTATQNYRVHNFVQPLMAYGWNVKVIKDRDALLEIDNKWDIIVFNRIAAGDKMIEVQNSYRKNGGILIYDIDDLIFNPERAKLQDSFIKRDKEGQDARLAAMEKIKASLLASDLVTVTTQALANQVNDFGKRPFVIPNSLQTNMPLAADKASDHINICYLSGTATHDKDFKECEQAIINVLRENENVVLNIVGELTLAQELENSDQLVRHDFMSHSNMLIFLSSMDINLAPLELNNEFTECKSELKIFEAAFYSVPTIASSTSSFAAAIANSVNGFVASNTEQWHYAINALVESKEYRQKIGQQAKVTIAVLFSSKVVAAKLHTLYRYLLINKHKSLLQLSNSALYAFAENNAEISSDIVTHCGLLDESFYKNMYPELIEQNAAEHYLKHGRNELRKSSKDFDGWWYDATQGEYNSTNRHYNPIVHAVFHATSNNCLLKAPRLAKTKQTFEIPSKPKRVCIFAGYDADGVVDDTLITYIVELSQYCDIFFMGDCEYQEGEIEKLAPYVQKSYSERHGQYDFGSYKKLMLDKLGWEELEKYDEVLLANDSVYLLSSLGPVFDKMSQSDCSFWGVQATKGMAFTATHKSQNLVRNVTQELTDELLESFEQTPYFDFLVGSYFVAFRKNVIQDEGFRKIIESISFVNKKKLILDYEVGISRYLVGRSFKLATYVEELHSFHPVYTENLLYLISKKGFPFLKRYLLANNHYYVPQLGALLGAYDLLSDNNIVKHLDRTIGKETLTKNLNLSLLDAYKASAFGKLSDKEFQELDTQIPKDPNLWVFPVCYYDHLLTGNDRALFEHVKNDPRIRKVILTRSKQIEMTGLNVYHFNIDTAEAQQIILRAKNIFLKHGPKINIPYPCEYIKRNFVNLWHGIPLKRIGVSSLDVEGARIENIIAHNKPNKCVISSSKIDRLAMTAGFYPLTYSQVPITGLPRIDLISMKESELPIDLQLELSSLRSTLAGRKLVLYAPTFRNAQTDGYYGFSAQELTNYKQLLSSNNAVLGVREHMADQAKSYNDILSDIECINLHSDNYPNIEMLYRLAHVLITDYSSCYIDYLSTRKPVISFAYDLDSYMQRERGFYYDIYTAFPGDICTDFDNMLESLSVALNSGVKDVAKYERVRHMFFDFDDQLNSQRVAELVYNLG